ncbi:MAG: transketolase, partial [Clostridium sp.]
PIDTKFEAFGWNTLVIDGHNMDEILEAIEKAKACTDKPTVVVCKTVKGKGVSFMENQASWHGTAPSKDQCAKALTEIGGDR